MKSNNSSTCKKRRASSSSWSSIWKLKSPARRRALIEQNLSRNNLRVELVVDNNSKPCDFSPTLAGHQWAPHINRRIKLSFETFFIHKRDPTSSGIVPRNLSTLPLHGEIDNIHWLERRVEICHRASQLQKSIPNLLQRWFPTLII